MTIKLMAINKWSDTTKNALNVVRYCKNVKGDLERGGDVVKNYRFSDECEWRYVPGVDKQPIFVSQRIYENESLRKKANKMANKIILKFGVKDIRYIIVK